MLVEILEAARVANAVILTKDSWYCLAQKVSGG